MKDPIPEARALLARVPHYRCESQRKAAPELHAGLAVALDALDTMAAERDRLRAGLDAIRRAFADGATIRRADPGGDGCLPGCVSRDANPNNNGDCDCGYKFAAYSPDAFAAEVLDGLDVRVATETLQLPALPGEEPK